MVNRAKLKEVFSDKAYVESIARLSAEDAAKSLQEKGVEVSADDLIKVRDFVMAHKDELTNGELSEEALASVAGGVDSMTAFVGTGILATAIGALAAVMLW